MMTQPPTKTRPAATLLRSASAYLALVPLLAVGCPAEPDGCARVSAPSRAEAPRIGVAPRPELAPSLPVAPAPRRLAGAGVSREEVLEAEPAEIWREVLARGERGLLPSGRSVACCAEQLRSRDVPLEALALVLVAVQRALDSGGPADLQVAQDLAPGVLKRLRRDLQLQSQGQPGLAAWTRPLAASLRDQRDAAAAKAYLERVYVLWRLARKA
jgi:hypothetical protein